MYLFENFIHSETENSLSTKIELTDELIRAGFHHDENFYKALSWLEKLAALQGEGHQSLFC